MWENLSHGAKLIFWVNWYHMWKFELSSFQTFLFTWISSDTGIKHYWCSKAIKNKEKHYHYDVNILFCNFTFCDMWWVFSDHITYICTNLDMGKIRLFAKLINKAKVLKKTNKKTCKLRTTSKLMSTKYISKIHSLFCHFQGDIVMHNIAHYFYCWIQVFFLVTGLMYIGTSHITKLLIQVEHQFKARVKMVVSYQQPATILNLTMFQN